MSNPFIDEEPDYFERQIRAMWFTGMGKSVHVHGPRSGREGIHLAAGQVKGIWHSQVETNWKSGAFQEGSKQKSVKWLHRDMKIGLHVMDSEDQSFEDNDSEFMKLFAYEEDEWDDDPEPTTLHIDTAKSGERKLDLLMYEEPEFDPDLDPIEAQYANLILKVRAGQPFWYQDDVIKTFSSSATSASGFIEVENPTPRPMKHKWILTKGTWTIPDVSWKGAKYNRRPGGVYATRSIPLNPITDDQGGIVISLDTANDLMVRDHNFTNALPALVPNGMFFMHVIPPYTPKQLLPISYTDAPAGGAMAQLVQPRRFNRPWGEE
ncbi:hypothetical protein [Mycolicibacterium sphagni]|uniref:Minor tail protein n=1 Tax=Mycolicibacterium sphagni TaxID=1786 RepID=A0A255DLZ9_9MYCO|nr:hypothetical protein [Mycolicibacterium sphagni]OYN80418.1 hypothetical protein CG716_09815 [Mycolicibacterium sphagni]